LIVGRSNIVGESWPCSFWRRAAPSPSTIRGPRTWPSAPGAPISWLLRCAGPPPSDVMIPVPSDPNAPDTLATLFDFPKQSRFGNASAS
jgi:hypothetical protein